MAAGAKILSQLSGKEYIIKYRLELL